MIGGRGFLTLEFLLVLFQRNTKTLFTEGRCCLPLCPSVSISSLCFLLQLGLSKLARFSAFFFLLFVLPVFASAALLVETLTQPIPNPT